MKIATENIIGSGKKGWRSSTHRSVYLDSRGKGRPKMWRAEVQTMSPGGIMRLRGWFKTREEAENWMHGR